MENIQNKVEPFCVALEESFLSEIINMLLFIGEAKIDRTIVMLTRSKVTVTAYSYQNIILTLIQNKNGWKENICKTIGYFQGSINIK